MSQETMQARNELFRALLIAFAGTAEATLINLGAAIEDLIDAKIEENDRRKDI